MAKSIQSNEKITISGLGNPVVEIHDLVTPAKPNDAASKWYVDNKSGGNSGSIGETTQGAFSIGDGIDSTAIGDFSLSVGYAKDGVATQSIGTASLASGKGVITYGPYSATFGCLNITGTNDAEKTAEGYGKNACAIGYANKAIGESSFAVGTSNTVNGKGSSALGSGNIVNGYGQCAIGYMLTIGEETTDYTNLNLAGRVALGKYNAYDKNSLFMIGNGTSSTSRKNAFSIKEISRTFTASSANTHIQTAVGNHIEFIFDKKSAMGAVNYGDSIELPDGTKAEIEEIWDGSYGSEKKYAFRINKTYTFNESPQTITINHIGLYLNEREIFVRPLSYY